MTRFLDCFHKISARKMVLLNYPRKAPHVVLAETSGYLLEVNEQNLLEFATSWIS